MASIKEEATKRFAAAYYGENAVIGDGKFLEMLLKFFSTFIGSCPLGARRAYAMVKGGPFQRRRARNQLEYAAYEWTGGDWDQTQAIVDAGLRVAEQSNETEFLEFAKEIS